MNKILPSEILTIIFLNVCDQNPKGILNISGVCHYWRNLVWSNEYFYLRLLKEGYINSLDYLKNPLLSQLVIKHEFYNILFYLLNHGPLEPSTQNNYILRYMCKYGYDVLLRVLLSHNPDLDPSFPENKCIKYSIKYRHLNCTILLLSDPRVDPCVDQLKCLKYTINNQDNELFNILMNDYRIKNYLQDPDTKEESKNILTYASSWSEDAVNLLIKNNVTVSYDALKVACDCLLPHVLDLLLINSSNNIDFDELYLIISETNRGRSGHNRVNCWKVLESYKQNINQSVLSDCIINCIRHNYHALSDYLLNNCDSFNSEWINVAIETGNVNAFKIIDTRFMINLPEQLPNRIIYALCKLVYVSKDLDSIELLRHLVNRSDFDLSSGSNHLLRSAIKYRDHKIIKIIWPKVENDLLNI